MSSESYTVKTVLTAEDKASSVLSRYSSSLGGLGSKIKSAIGFGAAMQVGMKAVSTAMSAVTSNIDSAVSRYDQLNNFPKVMSNLGISTEAANKAMKTLTKGIENVPTSLDTATQGVTRFVSKNGDIQKSTKYFLAMNNAILAGGASTEIQSAAVEQLSQAYSKGKMDMQEWRSIQTAMPAQLKQVAKAMGMTTDELGEGLRDGTVSMDAFMDKITELNEKGVDGMASFAEQAKTSTAGISTALTNMNTYITRGIANCISAIDEMLQNNGLPTIAEMINKASEKIVAAFEYLASGIKQLNIKGIIDGLTPAFTVLKGVLSGVADALKPIAKFANEHAEGLTKIATAALAAVVAFKGLSKIKGIFDGLKGIGTFSTSLGKFGKNGEKAAGAASNLKGALSGLMKMAGIAAIIASLALLATSLSKLGALGTTAVAPLLTFGIVVAGLAAVFSTLGKSLQSSMVGIVAFAASISIMALAMAPIANAGEQAATNMAVFGVVVAGLVAVFALFGTALNVAVPGMLALAAVALSVAACLAALPAVIDAVSGLVKQMGDTIQQVADDVADAFSQVADGIVDIIDAISGGFVDILHAIGDVFESIGKAAKNAGKGFKDVAEGIVAISELSIADIVTSLAAVAAGLLEISTSGANLPAVAVGMALLVGAITTGAAGIASFTASMILMQGMMTGLVGSISALQTAFSNLSIITPDVSPIIAAFGLVTAAAQQLIPSLRAAGVAAGAGLAAGLSAGSRQAAAVVLAVTVMIVAYARLLQVQLIASGRAAGTGFSNGLKSGLESAKSAAKSAVTIINATLRSASAGAYSAGYNIGIGLANGMRATLGTIRSIAAQLAVAANAAIEAKAKIGSPSKVTTKYGKWYGQGFVNGIKDKITDAKDMAERLVTLPTLSQPGLAMAGSYSGSFGETYDSGAGGTYVIEVPVNLDGKEVARITAPYTQGELNKLETRSSRKRGVR